MTGANNSTTGIIAPRQKRSEETLVRIMKGALSLLAERDLDGITIEDIARAAGVAVGTIYRRFENREALVLELLRRIQIQQLAALDTELQEARWRGKDLAARLAWLTERQLLAAQNAPGLVRAIFASIVNQPAEADEESVQLNSTAIAKIADWLLAASSESPGREARDSAAILVSNLLIGLNLATLYPAAFAPHGARKASAVLQGATLEALRALSL